MHRPRFDEACTKIVATVGPACDSVEMLCELIEAGVDVFRINSAHGTIEQHEKKLMSIRKAASMTGFQPAVLLDLSGPKLRLGQLTADPVVCEVGKHVTFVRGENANSDAELTSGYARLIDELDIGDRVMLADGTVTLRVESMTADSATCVVVAGGEVRSRQGINLPGVKLSVSAMRPDDIENAIWGAKNDIDFISLSFVRSAEDVRSLKDLLTSYESTASVIAKIEKPEAMQDLRRIVDAADGVMVARGDLGVEIDVAETPVAQKKIIQVCRKKLKPVIVATQMLESMHHSRRPTRAEASDVANAVLDGADACMLSGETAIGDFPREVVETMTRIIRATEQQWLADHPPIDPIATIKRAPGQSRGIIVDIEDDLPSEPPVHQITDVMTQAATQIAEAAAAKLIVVVTHSGGTAWVKSNSRSQIPTIAISDLAPVARRLNLFWGIKPMHRSGIEATPDLIKEICQWGRAQGALRRDDRIVIVTGGNSDRARNIVMVHTVE